MICHVWIENQLSMVIKPNSSTFQQCVHCASFSLSGVAAVQKSDGSFSACIDGSENDMRFVFCAAAICHMLDYWGDVDKDKMFDFIIKSIVSIHSYTKHTLFLPRKTLSALRLWI